MSYVPTANGYAARFAALVALLVKLPRTERELRRALAFGDRRSVEMHVRLLREEGLVYIAEWTQHSLVSKWRPVYAWQPSVCAHPDVPRPGTDVTSRNPDTHADDSARQSHSLLPSPRP